MSVGQSSNMASELFWSILIYFGVPPLVPVVALGAAAAAEGNAAKQAVGFRYIEDRELMRWNHRIPNIWPEVS